MATAKDKATPSTEIVEQKGAIVGADFIGAEDVGSGFEGADAESYAIPFLQVLQKMSPKVDEDNAAYIQGAKAGMLYNTVTGQLYDGKEGITIIPCAYKRSYVHWAGRESDGGYKGEFTVEEFEKYREGETNGTKHAVEVEGRWYAPGPDGTVNVKKSDYFADTRSHYVLTLDKNGDIGQAILALTSTQTKASRALMTALQQKKIVVNGVKRTPPMFANEVKLTTVGASNDKGSWSLAKFELVGMVTDKDTYAEAKGFYQAISTGAVKADFSKSERDEGGAGASGTPSEAEGF